MKRLYYFIRKYRKDIGVALIGIAGVYFTWQYGRTQFEQQGITLAVIVVTLLVIIYLQSREQEFVFTPLNWRMDKEFWIGHGVFQLNRVHKAYEITNADPGYIHADVLTWSNYKISFDFKIANARLGIIVRAVNLANYIMLQINLDGVRPHIRINGSGWKIFEFEESGLKFDHKLSYDSWYRCDVYCDKSTITFRIFSGQDNFFDRIWEIPRGDIIFEYSHSSEHPTVYVPLPITLEYGSIGFRNSGKEKAFVKNVLVEKL